MKANKMNATKVKHHRKNRRKEEQDCLSCRNESVYVYNKHPSFKQFNRMNKNWI
jgi:hypothetical protein